MYGYFGDVTLHSAVVKRKLFFRARRNFSESRPGGKLLLGAALISLGMLLPSSGRALALKPVTDGLVSPSFVASLPDGSGRLLVADQVGQIHLVSKEWKRAERPFLDLKERMTTLKDGFDERGLLSLALHPKFQDNRKLYVFYSAPLQRTNLQEWDCTSRISEFRVNAEGTGADLRSERIILEIDKPWFNHNGGALAFGPDGFLYISAGDGGNANDAGRGHSPQGNGQDLSTLLGKILRIDPDHGTPYAIPADNPFKSPPARPEIFAYGLRNPWRISFDRGGSHELFAGDVGQDLFEEVDIIVKGGNYGWNIREGLHCFDAKDTHHPPPSCPDTGADGKKLLDPAFEYKNLKAFPRDPDSLGVSVVGGYVYRGKQIPELAGQYVFADWSRNFVLPDGVLLAAKRDAAGRKWSVSPIALPKKIGSYVVGLGEDADGELYVMTNASNGLVGKTGKVFKLSPGE